MRGSKKIILQHGAVYGINFGDVLIQSLLMKLINEADNAHQVVFPLASRRFSKQQKFQRASFIQILAAKKIVFGPGGYFTPRPTREKFWYFRFNIYHALIIITTILLRKKIAIFGVGVGALRNIFSRFLVRQLFARAELACVRDPESIRALEEMDIDIRRVSQMPDIALSLMENQLHIAGNCNINDSQKTTVIDECLTLALHLPINNKNKDRHRMLIADIVKIISSQKYRIKILYDGPAQKTSEEIIAHMDFQRGDSICLYENVDKILEEIKKSDIVLTSKLHVAICATALGKKALSYYIHPKTPRFFKMISRSDFSSNLDDYCEGDLFSSLVAIERIATFVDSDVKLTLMQDLYRAKEYLQKFLNS